MKVYQPLTEKNNVRNSSLNTLCILNVQQCMEYISSYDLPSQTNMRYEAKSNINSSTLLKMEIM